MTADEALRGIVAETAGFDVEALGEGTFMRSVNSLMARSGLTSRHEYADAVRSSPSELQNLLEELVVPETWFFRDRGPFEFLKNWARAAAPRHLRLLSAACSTGEEPYSIAISLIEAGVQPDSFSIHAVDISERALDAAARAVYGRSSFREPWTGFRDYFTSTENGFALHREISELVHFHRDNVVNPIFLRNQPPYDVVFCRNLLIYLDAAARRTVLRNLESLLAPNGIVAVGASEVPALVQNGYAAVSYPNAFACSKAPATARRQQWPIRARTVVRTAIAAHAAPQAPVTLDTAWRLANEGALDEASQLCDTLIAESPNVEHCYLKGLISEAMNRLDAAEDFFRKALYLDPEHYPTLLHMSALAERRGDANQTELFRMRAKRVAERGIDLYEPRP